MSRLYLKQTLSEPIDGFWNGGPKREFCWTIERAWSRSDVSRIGSWADANYFFDVATGRTDRETLGNARRALGTRTKKRGITSTFEYVEE